MSTGLAQAHLGMLRDPKVLEEVQEELFKNVRILVVGRSGCGKSTLIRLMMEESAMTKMRQESPAAAASGDSSDLSTLKTLMPVSSHDGRAGVQDVWREWKHPELPITFHDTNGMDTRGESRLDDIKAFLERRQRDAQSSFDQRVHIVWYLVQSTDNRVADDGGLLKLVSGYDIPMLLVVTHADDKPNLKASVLQSLLQLVEDRAKAAFLEEHLVRVGNDVEEGILDLEGLRNLNCETHALLQEKQKFTWAAAQAIDMESKLAQSAELIVKLKRSSILSGFFLACIPAANQSAIISLFAKVHLGLCRIWQVPSNLKAALWSSYFAQESGHCVMRRLLPNLIAAAALGVAVFSTVMTAGLAAPVVAGVMLPAAVNEVRATPSLFMTYSLLVLGGILHVRCENGVLAGWSKHVETPVETFSQQCVAFSTSTNRNQLLRLVREHKSLWDSVTRTDNEAKLIKNQIVNFYRHLLKTRTGSLFSVMQASEQKDPAYNAPFNKMKQSTMWTPQSQDLAYNAKFNKMKLSTMWTPQSQNAKYSPKVSLAQEDLERYNMSKPSEYFRPPPVRYLNKTSSEMQNEVSLYDELDENPTYNDDNNDTYMEDSSTTFMPESALEDW